MCSDPSCQSKIISWTHFANDEVAVGLRFASDWLEKRPSFKDQGHSGIKQNKAILDKFLHSVENCSISNLRIFKNTIRQFLSQPQEVSCLFLKRSETCKVYW